MAEQLFTPQEFERFKEFQRKKEFEEFERFKNDPSGTSPTASVSHGLNPSGTLGLFGAPGVDPRMYATIVRANGSFSDALPAKPSRFLQVRREIVTGVNAPTGTNPTGFCGTAMSPGDLKVCRHDFEFGKIVADTAVIDTVMAGAYYNIADMDRIVIPPQIANRKFIPDVVGASQNPNSIVWKTLVQLGVNMERSIETVNVQGNKTAPNTGTGSQSFFISQYEGLDRLVKTGYTDVVTGSACTAVDSRVVNFGATLITATSSEGTIVDVLTDLYTGNSIDLENMGYSMQDSAFAFVLNPRMWRPLTRQWPCAYQTTGCDVIVNNDGQRLNVDAATQRRMQDEMYNGRFLMIDGMRIPVLFSWGIPANTVAPDTYNSTIYLVPLVLNGEQVTFFEFFQMDNPMQEELVNLVGANANSRVTNGGLYRMFRLEQGGCIQYKVAAMMRLRFDAPFAAGRVDNINFADRTRVQSPIPGQSYYADGGVTARYVYS